MSAADLPANVDPHDEAAANPPDDRPLMATFEPEPQGAGGEIAFAEIAGIGDDDNEGAWLTIDKSAVINMDQ